MAKFDCYGGNPAYPPEYDSEGTENRTIEAAYKGTDDNLKFVRYKSLIDYEIEEYDHEEILQQLTQSERDFFCEGEKLTLTQLQAGLEKGDWDLGQVGDEWVITKEFGPAERTYTSIGDFSVDLKWGCWCPYKDVWEDYVDDPKLWWKMRKMRPGQSVTISTAPRKECYGGQVTIYRDGLLAWRAEGYFYSMWDEPYELAQTLGVVEIDYGKWKDYFDHIEDFNDRAVVTEALTKYLVEEDNWSEEDARQIASESEPQDADCFRESLPFSTYTMDPGVDNEFEVTAQLFGELMAAIDEEENRCWAMSRREWNLLCDLYHKPEYKEKR